MLTRLGAGAGFRCEDSASSKPLFRTTASVNQVKDRIVLSLVVVLVVEVVVVVVVPGGYSGPTTSDRRPMRRMATEAGAQSMTPHKGLNGGLNGG